MLPTALARAIRLPMLTADQFTPTKWDDAATKAKFGNHLLRFIAEDFPESQFTQKFYQRLSNTSGHIAHYNRHGLWSEFFTHRATKIAFLEQTITHPCWGDPAWTYSDVERMTRARLKQSGILDWHRTLLAQERERAERAQYERLARKYGTGSNAPLDQGSPAMIEASRDRNPHSDRPTRWTATALPLPARTGSDRAEQLDLFAGI